jgi:restriction endonuclease S subunit
MKALRVAFQDINSAMRFDGSYHLSEGTLYLKKLIKMPHEQLDNLALEIFTAGRSKRIYTEKSYGYPYLSNTDVVKQNPFESCNYNSKKYGYDLKSFLKEGMIVTGRVGAIGQTAYINSELEEFEAMGSDNIIRIISKNNNQSGYIYAFLASKFGKTLLWKLAAGGVQPYISEDMLRDMPIPTLLKSKEEYIHKLIKESANLRVRANKLMRESIYKIESKFNFEIKETIFLVNINDIKAGDKYTDEKRLEADHYQPSTIKLEKQIKELNHSLLGDVCNKVSISNLRGRTFVKEGIVLFTGQSLGLLKPDTSKQMSKTLTRNIAENTTKDGDVLVSAFGTLGKVEYCYQNFYTGIFASQQIARIRVDTKKIDEGYIYLFLKSKLGQAQIQKYKTGSVIEWANWNNFSSIIVPIPADKGKEYGDSAREIVSLFDKAYKIEQEAINLIENEIESWQTL